MPARSPLLQIDLDQLDQHHAAVRRRLSRQIVGQRRLVARFPRRDEPSSRSARSSQARLAA